MQRRSRAEREEEASSGSETPEETSDGESPEAESQESGAPDHGDEPEVTDMPSAPAPEEAEVGAMAPENLSAPDPIAEEPNTRPLGNVPSGSLVTAKGNNYTVVGPSMTHPGMIKVKGPSRSSAYFPMDLQVNILQVA